MTFTEPLVRNLTLEELARYDLIGMDEQDMLDSLDETIADRIESARQAGFDFGYSEGHSDGISQGADIMRNKVLLLLKDMPGNLDFLVNKVEHL